MVEERGERAGGVESGPGPEADETTRRRPTGEPDEELVERMREEGWSGSPLVMHGDQVVGGVERYDAARFLGMENEVPRITLEEVYAEAGVDFPQVGSREGGPPPEEELFEDYLRELPRHVRDKYEL